MTTQQFPSRTQLIWINFWLLMYAMFATLVGWGFANDYGKESDRSSKLLHELYAYRVKYDGWKWVLEGYLAVKPNSVEQDHVRPNE